MQAGKQCPNKIHSNCSFCNDDFTCAIIFLKEYLWFVDGSVKLHFLKVCRSYQRLSSLPIPGLKVKTEDVSPQKAQQIDRNLGGWLCSLNPWDLFLHWLKIKALIFVCQFYSWAGYGWFSCLLIPGMEKGSVANIQRQSSNFHSKKRKRPCTFHGSSRPIIATSQDGRTFLSFHALVVSVSPGPLSHRLGWKFVACRMTGPPGPTFAGLQSPAWREKLVLQGNLGTKARTLSIVSSI